MRHVLSYYRCYKCHSITCVCSCVAKAPKATKHICQACGGVADVWESGELFWKALNDGKVEEAKKILQETK